MDITKNIAKAVLNKNYAEAKESIFKSLYAKASLAMDEARYYIADALFNRSAEEDAETVSEDNWGGGFQTSKEAWREEMKKMRAEAKWNRDKAKRAAKKAKAAKKAVKEEAETVGEGWSLQRRNGFHATQWREHLKLRDEMRASEAAKRAAKKAETAKKAVKEEAEQIDDFYLEDDVETVSEDMAQTRERSRQMSKKIYRSQVKGSKLAWGTKEDKKQVRAHNALLNKDRTERRSRKLYDKDGKLLKRKPSKKMGDVGNVKEDYEQIDEVSPPGMEKMTGSKKTKASFAKQYGKRGKEVMYATAWKLHNKKAGKD